jgi:hypothetical protein
MHSVTIHWISGYSQFAGGSIFMSYNVNKANKSTPFSVSSIFAQQSSGKSRLCENSSFRIPSSSWNQTPTRRSCQGIDDSYLFDLRYAVQTNETPQPISVWIEYDVTFHTPQIETLSSTPTIGSQYSILKFGTGENQGKPEGITIAGNKHYWNVEGSFSNIFIGFNYIDPPTIDTIYNSTSVIIAKLMLTMSTGEVKSYTIGYNHGSSTLTDSSNYLYLRADDEASLTTMYYWAPYTGLKTTTNLGTTGFKALAANTTAGVTFFQLYQNDNYAKVEVDYDPVLAKQNFIITPF